MNCMTNRFHWTRTLAACVVALAVSPALRAAEVTAAATFSSSSESGAMDAAIGFTGWFVVWREQLPDTAAQKVRGAILRLSGDVIPVEDLDDFAVPSVEPRVAFDPIQNSWAVAWSSPGLSSDEIHVRWVDHLGRLVGEEDFELPVNSEHIDIAAGSERGLTRLLLVWDHRSSDDERIMGIYLAHDSQEPSRLLPDGEAFRVDVIARPAGMDAKRPRLADKSVLFNDADGVQRSLHQIVYEVEGPDSDAIIWSKIARDAVFGMPIAGSRGVLGAASVAWNNAGIRALVVYERERASGVEVLGQYISSFTTEAFGPAFPIAQNATQPTVLAHAEEEFLVATSENESVTLRRVRGMNAKPILENLVATSDEAVLSGAGTTYFLGFRSSIATVTRAEGVLFREFEEIEENTLPQLDVPSEVTVVGGERFVLEATGFDADGDLLAYRWCNRLEEDVECPFGVSFEDGSFSSVAPEVDEPEFLRFLVYVDDLRGKRRFPTSELVEVKVVPSVPERFRRGDSDDSGVVNLTDAVFTLGSLFTGGDLPPCPDAADANDDEEVNITDAVLTLNFLFLGGAQPSAPGPFACGEDLTLDKLGDCEAISCGEITTP